MSFNVDKCKVLHVGRDNNEHQYVMNNVALKSVTEEKDLGVIISKDMKPSKQCTAARNKANRMLGLINRTITYKNEDNISKLYKALVRPHLEYAVQAWAPYHVNDKNRMEGVQRRATKSIPSLRNLPYDERLKKIKLYSLSYRRERGDLIEVYKIFNRIDDVDLEPLIELSQTGLRSNGLKIVDKTRRLEPELRRKSFSRRVPERWNKLPQHVVGAPSHSSKG